MEQKLIDNIAGLCKTNTAGFQAYIHRDLIDKFADWLNGNMPGRGEDSDDMSWETIALDDDALITFEDSADLCSLMIGRTKIGYAKDREGQVFYQELLTQAFRSPRS
ncbi:MAG: hypothetical protein KAG93_05145 [Desulfuromusa sp.]|nr:hypothetical protein [Desulfuromusa sp.]